jgi:hypothetical protein
MPAARLATSVQGAPFTVLGFTSVPSNEQSLRKLEAHFTASGSTELKRDKWLTALAAAMGTGVAGGPVVGERGDVMGFLIRRPGGSPSDLTLVQPAAIRAALSAAKIDPHSGPTDSAYESAMHNYKNKLYTAAIPSLAQTVKLYPGHALATEALAQANRKKGTADDLTGRVPVAATTSEGDSLVRRAVVPLAVAAIALIVLAGLVVLLLRRRRRPGAVPAAEPDGGAPTVLVPAPRQSPVHPQSPAAPHSAAPQQPYSRPGVGTMNQQTVLHSRPASARVHVADTVVTCPVCSSPGVPAQTFCAQCGQRLR